MNWLCRVSRPFLDPRARIPMPIQLWGEPPRGVGWPEALGSAVFLCSCFFLLLTASILAAPAPFIQFGLFMMLWGLDMAMLVWLLMSWVIRWAVWRGWMRY